MTLKNVKTSLDKISKSLAQLQDNREFLLRNTREIVVLCSRSIIAVHKGDLKIAKKNLEQADILLKKYKKKAESDLRRYLVTPEQEFVEAACLIAIVERKHINEKQANNHHNDFQFSEFEPLNQIDLPHRFSSF